MRRERLPNPNFSNVFKREIAGLPVFPFAKHVWINLLLLSLLFSSSLTYSQSDGLPRGAYEMPYTRYEAESANRGGGAVLHEALTFDETQTAAEASDQKYVGLPANGAYVEWTVSSAGDGITLRFTMPDSGNGEGESGALDIYVNGSNVKTIDLTSYWAYQYFPGSEPENQPGNRPRMRFDEVHFMLNVPLSAGDELKIQKNNGDAFEYGIDFVEIESVPAPLSKPAEYVSVTDFGAIPDDGVDDLPAFEAALSAAGNAGTGVYIPEGTFTLDNKWVVEESNIGIIGAGMWHTTLYFSNEGIFSGGIMARASDVEIAHFYMNTANNQRFLNPGQYMIYKGFMGTYGNNSSIHHVWVTHFECGAWIGGYDPPYPIDITKNLDFSHNRIRNNYADGINFCQGTSNSTVSHCSFRSNGDDAMAVWPNSDFSAPMGVNNIFKFNTIEHNYRAGGAAIFGGDGHEVHHCIFKDGMGSSAIRLTTDFPGYHFENTSQIRFYENTIIACGTSNDLWNAERGAIEINATNYPIQNIYFENIDIINAQRHAVQIGSNQSVNAFFDNIHINGTGLDGETEATYTIPLEGAAIMAYTGSGTATFNNLSLENIALDPPTYKAREGFNLVIDNVDIPLTGITLSKSNMDMVVGEEEPLSVSFSPANASNKTVTWSSSDPAVATYDVLEGKVVAHAIGSAIITVTSQEGGFTANATVTVNAAVNIKAMSPNASEEGTVGVFVIETSSLTNSIDVKYTISGTASPNDYTASPELSGSVALTPAHLSQTITITPVSDGVFEGEETLILTLLPDNSYNLGSDTVATVTITDDDAPPCTSPVIAFTEAAPTIDQNIESAWSTAPPRSISNATIGSIPNDFSGQWRAMYDADNLYVLVEVDDANLQNDSGGEWWNDDAVEIFIDGDNSKGNSYDGQNDFQYAFRWNDALVKTGGNSVSNTSGIDFELHATASGYNLEVAIPWTTIGIVPAMGNQIGFDVAVNNDDNGGNRNAQIASFATSDAGWANPSLFGTVYLSICDGSTPSNRAPIAHAGEDRVLSAGTVSATLNGSGSDPDGDTVSYSWSQVSGQAVTINNSTNATANINGLTDDNTYVFRLTVSDGVLEATDDVQIKVATSGGGGELPGNGETRGAYQMPYTRYESETGNYGGGASVEGPTYDMALLASEATDRQFVNLPSSGSYVEWTVTGTSQDGLTLRYSLPDNTNGVLGLYINGSKIRDIDLTSYWAWQYFDVSPSTTGVPSNTPQGMNPEPRMRFDELHFILPNSVNAGDVIRLQKDNNDGNAYGIDFIELESVPAVVSQPEGFLNIMDYGATPNDETNDAAAFRTCLDIANGDPSIKGIYIPSGRFINGQGNGSPTGNIWVPNENLTIQGAGMWHTEIYFSSTNQNGAGFLFDANNIQLRDFYMNSATNSRIAGNKAVNGSLGSGSTITNVWVEHFETGFWITSMQGNGWNITDGLVISNCRIRNVYADGVNFAKGTSNSIVEHTSFRNCIDDAMASWSVNYIESVPSSPNTGNIFRYSTVENNLRAAGVGFFGGHSHEAHHLLIKDNFAGPGIRVNTQFPAFPFGSNQSEAINIHDITVIGCGTTKNIWTYRFGAIELELPDPTQGQRYDLQYVNFSDIDIIDSQHDAVFVHSYMSVENDKVIDEVYFNNVNINGTGVALDVNNGPLYTSGGEESGGHGIYVANFSTSNAFEGWIELSDVSFANIAGENIAYYNAEGDFEVRIGGATNAPVAHAGADQSLPSGAISAALIGSGTDPDGAPLQYNWTQVSGPAVAISNSSSATAQVNGLSDGNTYVFRLTVSNGLLSATDDVQISVVSDNGNEGATAYRIKNRWQNTYLYDGGDRVKYSATPSGSEYEWMLEDVGEGYQEIKNLGTGEYMHIENLSGYVQNTERTFGWYSSRWAIEDAGNGFSRIRNAWQGNQYIHVENLEGHAQYGSVNPAWESAQWMLEPIAVQGSSTSNTKGYSAKPALKDFDTKVAVYPNPLRSGDLTISYEGVIAPEAFFALYDLSGKLIYQQEMKDNIAIIDREKFVSGTYILKVISGVDIINKKVIIE